MFVRERIIKQQSEGENNTNFSKTNYYNFACCMAVNRQKCKTYFSRFNETTKKAARGMRRIRAACKSSFSCIIDYGVI